MMDDIKRKTKSRGNGQGTAYRRNGTWTASVVVGWRFPEDPSKPRVPVKRTKSGFATKRDALAYCPQLMLQGNQRVRKTLAQVYQDWSLSHKNKVIPSTMEGYRYAFQHFRPLDGTWMDLISADDLQRCMDACKSGKRTHENMKCIAGLLWKYAVDKNIVDRNVAQNLYTGKGRSVAREPLTPEEEETIRKAIGRERYAEYIYCLCWLGYRPGEMLELKKDQLFFAQIPGDRPEDTVDVWYFVNGKKTDAGRDRIVIVPEPILPVILDRLFIPGTDLLFPMYQFTRGKNPKLKELKPMTDAYFRVEVFKPMMKRLGIAEKKVPYAARHSYADKLKSASGTDQDKASLIGHSKYLFTQSQYQSATLADLKAVVDSFRK